ncbi:MAG TPA: hypothetical protein VHF01_13985 [Candidatus Acidoferrum sp.]|nr:hypothetical protein [Candidatus Acidoferrum sp.]
MSTTPGTELSAVAKARAESELHLGREAASVRGNRDAILAEALHIQAASLAPKS